MLLYFSSSCAALPRWRLSCRFPGCPPRFWPSCPPRPRRRPPCRLLIKMLRPYAVSLAPLKSGKQGRCRGFPAAPAPDPLVPYLRFRAPIERPIASGVGTGCALMLSWWSGPGPDSDVVRLTPDAKRFSLISTLTRSHGHVRRSPARPSRAIPHAREASLRLRLGRRRSRLRRDLHC
jgi:hypothetical protein